MVVPMAAAIFVLAGPLIYAWLGTGAETVTGAIPVLQILSVAVAIRVGDATSTTLLKGAGSHKLVAGVNLAAGLVNVALSALLIRRFGLIGVAYGTLIPIACAAVFVLFPAACRRVGVPGGRAFMHAVVRRLWSRGGRGGFLFLVRAKCPRHCGCAARIRGIRCRVPRLFIGGGNQPPRAVVLHREGKASHRGAVQRCRRPQPL